MNNVKAKLVDLAYLITTVGITQEILDKIANFFGVDACSVVSVKDMEITYVESSGYFKEHSIDIASLYTRTKDENLLFLKAIKEGIYNSYDYQHDKNANCLWKETGIKSALLLKLETEFNAVIGLENFSKKKVFTDGDIDNLNFLSAFIAKALESRLFRDVVENRLNILDIQPAESDDKEAIRRWLEENLKIMLEDTHSKAISFVFPKYNIYAFLSKNPQEHFIKFKRNKDVNEMLTYRIYKRKIKGAAVFRYEFAQNESGCMKKAKKRFNINNILTIPVYDENGTLLSVIGYGYASEYHFSIYDVKFTEMIAKKLTNYISSAKRLSKLKNIITKSEEDIINSFILTIEMRDVYTKGHSQRVAFYAKRIAQNLKLKQKLTEKIYVAGLLHDIGKISIPDSVLLKPSTLSKIEYEMIKYHPVLSYELVNKFKSLEDLQRISKMVRQHHERCDGGGYPDSLSQKQITIGARILAIADVFDALTTSRPYRNAFSPKKAIKIMKSERGHLDNKIFIRSIDVLINSFQEAKAVGNKSIIPKAFDSYKKKFADIDPMSGLLKRSAFILEIDAMLRSGIPFKLYLIDIKSTDLLNIKYGNEFGDKLIIQTAETLSELKQYNNIKALSRIGGDSFMFAALYNEQTDNFEKIDNYLSNLPQLVKNRFKDIKNFPSNLSFTVVTTDYTEGNSAIELIFASRKHKKETWSADDLM